MMMLILEFIVKMGIIFLEFMGIVIFAFLIQGLVYNISNKKINLYKIISYNLIDKYIK